MAMELFVEPRKVYTWSQFKKEKEPYSIALDGIVNDVTEIDEAGPYANFDHHSKVGRIATRSTCKQVAMYINLDLFDLFKVDGIPTANIYVNDPDEDTCLGYWLLKHHEEVGNHANPRINRLVDCEDRLDCTAGAYPFGDIEMRRKMAWIFEPYNDLRFKGQISELDEGGMRNVIEAVCARIDDHIYREGGEVALEGHYEKIGGGDNWVMVKETGPASRLAMYNDGIKAFTALVAEKEDGSYVYVMGRKSECIRYPIPYFIKKLNKIEAEIVNDGNLWGGSDTIMGSPRITGSKIPPDRMQEEINLMIKEFYKL